MYSEETHEVFLRAIELLIVIIKYQGIFVLEQSLPSLLQSLLQLTMNTNNDDVYSVVFPFISAVSKAAIRNDLKDILAFLMNFNSILEAIVFNYSSKFLFSLHFFTFPSTFLFLIIDSLCGY